MVKLGNNYVFVGTKNENLIRVPKYGQIVIPIKKHLLPLNKHSKRLINYYTLQGFERDINGHPIVAAYFELKPLDKFNQSLTDSLMKDIEKEIQIEEPELA